MAAEYTTRKALAYGVLLQSLYSRLLIVKRPDRWKFFTDPREIRGGRTRTSIILERSMIFRDDRISIRVEKRRRIMMGSVDRANLINCEINLIGGARL